MYTLVMHKRIKFGFLALISAGLLVLVVLLVAPKPAILPEIKRQISFSVYLPTARGVKIDANSVKYDKELKLLSFTLSHDGRSIVVSEQAAPDAFIDVPDYYAKVMAQMGEYKTFDVPEGTVHLTRPAELQGRQTAVLTSGGTLMFFKATTGDLSDDAWRSLLKTVELKR